ncbi:jg22636 [Pararge aegeria aegeria]|uniref:Jg22636 protein n=1 Tax=Pararge aegeria aegeria TaxID=348720 RepID=A0A8S4R6S0_9NEOP|nr:jg22636 [Pararge aegeria aegeria]
MTAQGMTIAVMRPVMEDWHKVSVSHRSGVITRLDCSQGLCCRGKKNYCDDCLENTAQHTLEVCPAWAEQRRALQNTATCDLSLLTIVRIEIAWTTSLCEEVMSAKEEAERESDRTSTFPSRRRRTRRRRGINDLRPP